MSKHKLTIIGFSLVFLITSCRKNDVPYNETADNIEVSKSSDWKLIANWASEKNEKFSTFTSAIEDGNITTDVVSKGLVLAFTKSGNSINALPYQQSGGNDAYWYYQVSPSSITFLIDAYKENKTLKSTEFKYFIVTPDQLKDLETKGYSRIELMLLTYEDAVALLKK